MGKDRESWDLCTALKYLSGPPAGNTFVFNLANGFVFLLATKLTAPWRNCQHELKNPLQKLLARNHSVSLSTYWWSGSRLGAELFWAFSFLPSPPADLRLPMSFHRQKPLIWHSTLEQKTAVKLATLTAYHDQWWLASQCFFVVSSSFLPHQIQLTSNLCRGVP